MDKKEYAMLHYLLAKLKYDLAKELKKISNKQMCNENIRLINIIDEIEKLMIIGGDNND